MYNSMRAILLGLFLMGCGVATEPPGESAGPVEASPACVDGALVVEGPASHVLASYDVPPDAVLAHRWEPAAIPALEGDWIDFDFAVYAPVPAGVEARMWTYIVPLYDEPLCPVEFVVERP